MRTTSTSTGQMDIYIEREMIGKRVKVARMQMWWISYLVSLLFPFSFFLLVKFSDLFVQRWRAFEFFVFYMRL